uniref:Uncharacterized protein n=1 Tax=viral metagenome TaxID=1070528 RepID=A0A6C0CRI4_9ZZZZ
MDLSDIISKSPNGISVADSTPELSSSPNMITTVKNALDKTVEKTEEVSSGLPWESIIRYGLIIIILAFLGFNLFTFLGGVTDTTKGILAPLFSFFGYGVGETVKQTTNVAAEGAKTAVDVAAGTVDDAVTLMEKAVGVKNVQFNRIDDKTTTTQTALTNAIKKQNYNVPDPDESGSITQQSKSPPKSGFCYIGEDRGFRSCIKVGEGDKCMSGDIFPSKEICINPSLRE